MDHENLTDENRGRTRPAVAERTRSGCCYRPDVDILEQDDELLVLADVPGASSDAIDVNFEDGMLEIRAAVAPRHDGGEPPCCRNMASATTIGASV